jgi:hypothetical protein
VVALRSLAMAGSSGRYDNDEFLNATGPKLSLQANANVQLFASKSAIQINWPNSRKLQSCRATAMCMMALKRWHGCELAAKCEVNGPIFCRFRTCCVA